MLYFKVLVKALGRGTKIKTKTASPNSPPVYLVHFFFQVFVQTSAILRSAAWLHSPLLSPLHEPLASTAAQKSTQKSPGTQSCGLSLFLQAQKFSTRAVPLYGEFSGVTWKPSRDIQNMETTMIVPKARGTCFLFAVLPKPLPKCQRCIELLLRGFLGWEGM